MKTHKSLLICLTLFGSVTTVYATNGAWSHGYGAKSKSIAGACVAMRLGSMCAATNPGTMVEIGNKMDYGLTFFAPKRGFNANDDASAIGPPTGPTSIVPGYYESDNDWFLIPHFGYNQMLDDKSSIAITVGGNGGMNTEYDAAVFRNFGNPMDSSTQASSPTGVDLMQMFIGVTYSRKITEKHSIGIMPILAIQAFEAQGLQPFTQFSAYPDKVTNNGHDLSYGGGIRIGWLGKVTNNLSLGASYQSKMWMSNFDKYKGLFAEAGNFDIPATYDLGFAFKMTPKLTFAFDYQRIEYGSVKALANASDIAFMPGQTLLGTNDGLGFGWEDMKIFKLGLQWEYSHDLTLRFGYSYANDAFPNTQALFNVLAPATIQQHYTFGFSTNMSETLEFTMAFLYAPNEKVYGNNLNTG
ncbi:MAG: outer membrane protein transport protein, partial [Thiotrichaceae bacterium]|nr:outer membrane protein transport protein [Thiotrichaceae bacterium]